MCSRSRRGRWSSLRPETRRGSYEESEGGGKREGESCWKSGGGRMRLYTWPRVGLADEASSNAIPEAAGGEGGHAAAKPDGVTHTYVFYQSQRLEVENGANPRSKNKLNISI